MISEVNMIHGDLSDEIPHELNTQSKKRGEYIVCMANEKLVGCF